jgi:hypothetical protein
VPRPLLVPPLLPPPLLVLSMLLLLAVVLSLTSVAPLPPSPLLEQLGVLLPAMPLLPLPLPLLLAPMLLTCPSSTRNLSWDAASSTKANDSVGSCLDTPTSFLGFGRWGQAAKTSEAHAYMP